MKPDDTTIKDRLEEVLQSIVCPVSGCCDLRIGKSNDTLSSCQIAANDIIGSETLSGRQ